MQTFTLSKTDAMTNTLLLSSVGLFLLQETCFFNFAEGFQSTKIENT